MRCAEPYFAQTTAAPTDPNILYNLQQRIADHHVIDANERRSAVEAILRGGTAGGVALNRYTDTAVQRWHELDEVDREDFRTAVRDFVRAYSFLAQIVPFTDVEIEELYYYGKYLVTRLSRSESGGERGPRRCRHPPTCAPSSSRRSRTSR